MIMTNNPDLAKRINSAVFPGLQGGPLMHVIAAKAVALGEALKPEFKEYARNVVDNAKVLAETLQNRGLDIVSGGTDTHLMLVDLRPKHLTGKIAEKSLERAFMTCNKNGIPFDPEKPMVTSGIRLGSNAPYALSAAADFLESSIIPVIIGVAITAIIARITITAKSSINVKPFFFICLSPPYLLLR